MPQTRVQILQAMPVFGAIDESAINWLLDGARVRAVSRGECVFREGDMDSSIYVIEEGRFTVYRHWGGRDYRLRELGTGDCFGETSHVTDAKRNATIRAADDVELLSVSATLLEQVSNACQLRFTREFLGALIQRLQGSNSAST